MGQELLNSIRNNLLEKRDSIHIQGNLRLTKSAPAYCDAVLLRDLDLEKDVIDWIAERSNFAAIMGRYQHLSEVPISNDLPEHYAMRVLSGKGAICSGRNIFLFFPHCLGLTQYADSECFGMELIDVWRNVFEKVVFPCARTALGNESLMSSVPQLLRSLEKTTYLASVFHEVGHRVGPWRVSPVAHPDLKVSAFHLDVMGELSTDCILVRNLLEFPEIATFVTLQRLFWFGRRGYLDNPRSAWINQDNDSWITACLWNELVRKEILFAEGANWRLRSEELPAFYRHFYAEVERVGNAVLSFSNSQEQDEYVSSWMKTKVLWNEAEGFVLPATLQRIFSKCSRFPEIPQFNPILDLNHEELV